MKTIVLDLIDEHGQSLAKVPIENYAIPVPGEETGEALDNETIISNTSELISSIFKRIEDMKAEPIDSLLRTWISISEAILSAAESEGAEITIPLKVRAKDAVPNA